MAVVTLPAIVSLGLIHRSTNEATFRKFKCSMLHIPTPIRARE
jgi:hypothetical protein